MAEVLIIGGGVAGLEAALTLARSGVRSIMVEKNTALGGQARHYNCKAVDGICQACGACLALQKAEEALKEDYIRILPGAEITGVEKDHGSYSVAVRYKEQLLYPTVAGIVVAVGLSLWPAEKRGEFGYTRLPGVITSLDLEIILQQTPEALGLAPRIAFIQCVGSRDTVREFPTVPGYAAFMYPGWLT